MDDAKNLVEKLEKVSIQSQLPKSFDLENTTKLVDRDIDRLLGYASLMSLSDDSDELSLSYEVITRLLEYTKGELPGIVSAADVILSRVGNFPGRSLLRKRHASTEPSEASPLLRLESLAREVENTVYYDDNNSTLLTDFQYKLLDSLSNEESLSVSAPTSAGKSFVLNIDLIRRIKNGEKQSIVYIVPTRALISEVSQRIRKAIRESNLDNIIVRTAPFPVSEDRIGKAAVYVFTQERLMSFMNSEEEAPQITSLIVDEAHEIQKGKRGIILQTAIEIAISRFHVKHLFFASPLIKNPSYLLSTFGKTQNGKYFVEPVSPVSQNLILLSEVPNKTKCFKASLVSRSSITEIGIIKVDFKFRAPKLTRTANLANAISSGNDSVIVFSNEQAEAEKLAEKIGALSANFSPSEEILTFIDFLNRELHSEHPLISCLSNGVAFHYGCMPSLVRSGIENLFKNGDIKIICCTSTLLQGVNLPAKHIIIENPRSGRGNPMTRSDFLNLSGRAGRLLYEFHGNIWCINPETWDSDCHQGEKLQEISSAISEVMLDGGLSVQKLLSSSIENETEKDEAEAAFGKIYHDFLANSDFSFIEAYRNEENSPSLDRTIESIKEVRVTLPRKILENHQSLRPDYLQKLYNELSLKLALNDLIPISPFLSGSLIRMKTIFKIICKCFNWKLSDSYMNLISMISFNWVRGEPIGKILSDRISWIKENRPQEKTPDIIRSCLNVLENEIRFKLVKYYSAYIEIIRHVLSEKKQEDLRDNIEPYHIYLEFGSSNRHALNLMALGFSRFTALHLEKKFDFDKSVEAEAYIDRLKNMNLDSIGMPALCLKEVKDLLG